MLSSYKGKPFLGQFWELEYGNSGNRKFTRLYMKFAPHNSRKTLVSTSVFQGGENRVWLTQPSNGFLYFTFLLLSVTKNTKTAQMQKADGSRSSYWTEDVQERCNLWNTKTMLISASSCFFLYFSRPFVTETKEMDTICVVLLFQYISEAGKRNGTGYFIQLATSIFTEVGSYF